MPKGQHNEASSKSVISAIAAIEAKTRGLGRAGELLWHIPEDLKRFKETTLGHPIIMGRKTFDSIGRALSGRLNIVLTKNPLWKKEGVITVSTLEEAVTAAEVENTGEIFVIGGAEIYRQALPCTDRLYLTLVDDPTGIADVFFPDYSEFTKTISESEERKHNNLSYRFIVLEK